MSDHKGSGQLSVVSCQLPDALRPCLYKRSYPIAELATGHSKSLANSCSLRRIFAEGPSSCWRLRLIHAYRFDPPHAVRDGIVPPVAARDSDGTVGVESRAWRSAALGFRRVGSG